MKTRQMARKSAKKGTNEANGESLQCATPVEIKEIVCNDSEMTEVPQPSINGQVPEPAKESHSEGSVELVVPEQETEKPGQPEQSEEQPVGSVETDQPMESDQSKDPEQLEKPDQPMEPDQSKEGSGAEQPENPEESKDSETKERKKKPEPEKPSTPLSPVANRPFNEQKKYWLKKIKHRNELVRVGAAAHLADLMATAPNVDEDGAQVLKESADTFREWVAAKEEITRLNLRRDQLRTFIYFEQNKDYVQSWITYLVMKKMKSILEARVNSFARKYKIRRRSNRNTHYTTLH